MQNFKTILIAAVTFLMTTVLSFADENTNSISAGNPITSSSQGGKSSQPVYDYQKNMPNSVKQQSGYGVGFPGARGNGGTEYPQHNQYGNPPAYKAGQASQPQKQPATAETNSSVSGQPSGTTKLRSIHRDNRKALLHAASFGDLASLNKLLKQGVSPNARAKDKTARTALILAAAGGHVEIVDALLTNGANVDDRDRTGHTALNWAALRGRTQVVAALLKKGADVNTQDNGGISPLLYAIGTHNIPMLKLLVANDANLEVETRENKMTPLLLAIETKDIKSINILLDKGVNVNLKNRDNFSPLMAAAEKGQTDVVQALLARGAKVNQQDNKRLTPLIYAADNQHIETMQVLLAKGADANARDGKTETVIMRAAVQGHIEVIKVLLANGANINASDASGRTALILATAASKVDAIKLLLENGADSKK